MLAAGAALGGGVQGSGPPSPYQGHLWEMARFDEFFVRVGGVGELRGMMCSNGWLRLES